METLAGHCDEGHNDGDGANASMRRPSGLCIDPHGYCFFADTGSCVLISSAFPTSVCVFARGAGEQTAYHSKP